MDDTLKSALETGLAWFAAHQQHVAKMLDGMKGRRGVMPSGSDLHNPALWKDIHWKWFLSQTKRKDW